MGFSSLANMSRRINPCPNGRCRYSKRNGPVTGMVIHYNYGVNSHGEATNPGREVSANYWITNDGQILPNIDENYRAWTSGAKGYPNGAVADHHSITVEISNSPGFKTSSPMGAISPQAQTALEKLMADVFRRYRLGTPKRTKSATGVGVRFHNDFVSTSCPGPWIASRINTIMANAAKLMGKTPASPTQSFTQGRLVVDGLWGPATTRALQQINRTPVDGVVSSQPAANRRLLGGVTGWDFTHGRATGSSLVRALQKAFKVSVDGFFGPESIRGMQRYYGTVVDGVISPGGSLVVKTMQSAINKQLGKK